MGSKKKVFAFDLGKASVGYCVREGFDIQETGSLIVDKDHAEVASNRDRRRVHKTLKSHKAREKFFNELWQKARLEVPDENLLKKEFSGKSDDTIYISCLLRIALLQNQKLETWQIYKALRNAIQRRGYDAKLPWANAKTKDDEDNEKWAEKYTTDGDLELIKNEEYKYPCYYDAIRLGLWDENNPTEFKRHIPLAGVVKVRDIGLVAPRSMVVAELTKLWESAQKQLENLRTIPVETFLYGERGEAYASYLNKDFKHERGTEKDWTGVLGQKIPRFDNRIIMKCKLLPKRNVCKSATLENVSFTLLMKLKNLRFTNEEGEKAKLSPNDIKAIYGNWLQKATAEKLNTAITKQERDKILSTTITKKEIEDVIGKKSVKDKIEPMKANVSGRSSFCCTACKIMNKIILEGILYPNEMDIAEFVDRPGAQNGITAEEVQTMLEKVGDWNNLYIPDSRNEMAGLSCDTIEQTDIVIGGVTNPIVRNRLQIFRNKLVELIYGTKNKSGYGKPDEVIFEFIRDGVDRSLMPGKKASDMEKYMKEQEKYNAGLREKLGDDYSPTNFEKLKLHEMQDGRCIYSGKRIGIQTDFHRCEIDHIYPRSMGGNDALYNKVLCFSEYNQDKEGRTPYEWLHGDDYKWQEYVDTVKDIYEKTKSNSAKKNTSF
jgi:CRISPR-associated endonuclease Csn1